MSVPKPTLRLRKGPLVAFSPSGRYLAQATARVVVWDLNARNVISQMKLLSHENYLCFSPDDKVLAIKNTNGELAFCDPISGSIISQTGRFSHYREGCQPAISADGTHLIDGDWNGILRRVDVASATDAESHDFGFGYMFGGVVMHHATGRFVAAMNAKGETRGGSKLLMYESGQALRRPTVIDPVEMSHSVEGGWRHIDKIVMHPSGHAVALILDGRTPEEPNCIVLCALDGRTASSIPLPSRMHFVQGLAWSQHGVICAAVHENIHRQGISSAEWQQLREKATYDHIHFYSETPLALTSVWPWSEAWSVAFAPDGLGLAVGARGGASAYFANPLASAPVAQRSVRGDTPASRMRPSG